MPEQLPVLPFHGAELRAAQDGDTIWVAVKPICEHLGIDWPSQYTKLRQDDDFNHCVIPMVAEDGKVRDTICLSSDQLLGWLYTISSNRVSESARPLLRSYKQETTQVINDYWLKGKRAKIPQTYAEALQAAADAERERERLAAENLVLAPKGEAFDTYMDTEGTHEWHAAAKAIGWGRNNMLKELRKRGVLMSGGDKQNVPYQPYVERGYFVVKVKSVKTIWGFEKVATTTYVTPRGLEYLRKLLSVDRSIVLALN